MIKDSTEDKEMVQSLEDLINSKQISKTLFALRCRANMSQSDVAKKMNCSQGKVSKIENAGDTDLTIHDLVQYCSAVSMRLEIGFSDERMTMVDQVKYHYFRLRKYLDNMREMARGDETMEKGVESFTKEAFMNISFGLLECVQKASNIKLPVQPLHVSTPVTMEDINKNTEHEANAAAA